MITRYMTPEQALKHLLMRLEEFHQHIDVEAQYPLRSVQTTVIDDEEAGIVTVSATFDYNAFRKPMPARGCSLGVGCEDVGVCYAVAHNHPEMCGATRSKGPA